MAGYSTTRTVEADSGLGARTSGGVGRRAPSDPVRDRPRPAAGSTAEAVEHRVRARTRSGTTTRRAPRTDRGRTAPQVGPLERAVGGPGARAAAGRDGQHVRARLARRRGAPGVVHQVDARGARGQPGRLGQRPAPPATARTAASTSVRKAVDHLGVGRGERLEHEEAQIEVGRAPARPAPGGWRRSTPRCRPTSPGTSQRRLIPTVDGVIARLRRPPGRQPTMARRCGPR